MSEDGAEREEDEGRVRVGVTELRSPLPKIYGSGHENTLHVLSLYAGVLWKDGRVAEARRCLEVIIAARRDALSKLPQDGPDTSAALRGLVDAMEELETVLMESSQESEACVVMRSKLELLTKWYGQGSEQVGDCLNSLARALSELCVSLPQIDTCSRWNTAIHKVIVDHSMKQALVVEHGLSCSSTRLQMCSGLLHIQQ